MTGELRAPEHRAKIALNEAERERIRAIDGRLVTRRVTEGASAPDAPSYEEYLAAYKPQTLSDGRLSVPLPRHMYDANKHLAAAPSGQHAPTANVFVDTDSAVNVVAPQIDTTSAAWFCAEAARLVGGPRAATHGDKTINFQNIAELWNGYWRIKCRMNDERLSTPFTEHDVGCMMELFKIARRFSGSFNPDDYVDAAGYAGCTGEIAAKDAQK